MAEEAVAAGRRALDIALANYGANHPATAEAMRVVGDSLAHMPASRDQARRFLEGAATIDGALPTPHNFGLAADLNNLALVEEADGDLTAAADHPRRSVAIFEKAGLVDSLNMAVALMNLAKVYATIGLKAEAASSLELAGAIFDKIGADRVHRDRSL